ncbi:hypothetical protein [Streptomyces sp. t39]|uniref:hypothetical protein n=1 Tax=Streptomyces sp. t39 TaxID=1828156 RepID=UPI0011CE682F|nr:hypothetical protein [Streptomyces sp. t39]TXS35137.1 hypothetical protein EAO77_37750 [Streptomyces sp. t39]
MTSTVTLAASSGAAFGAVGTGGVALVFAVILALGIRGEGRVKLSANPATYLAFIAATAFMAAGQMWSHPEALVGQGLTGLGVGQGPDGPFGNVGIGAVCLILVAVFLMAKLSPLLGAGVGLVAGIVFPVAGPGTIWQVPVQLAHAVIGMLGG